MIPVTTAPMTAVLGDVAGSPSNIPQGQSSIELELIQTQMAQKLMLRAEVYARALGASQNYGHTSMRIPPE
jgi:hypothetical protein